MQGVSHHQALNREAPSHPAPDRRAQDGQTSDDQTWAYLSSEPAGRREIRLAWVAVLVLGAFFLATVSYARIPLAQFPIFIPIYITLFIISDLITAVLLFGQYRALQSTALLVLAGGYFFTAAATFAYALIFPGLLAPTGLLGSGPQTSSAMYMFWHTGFPLAVIAYALMKEEHPAVSRSSALNPSIKILATIVLVVVGVAAYLAFATAGQAFLPVFLDSNRTTIIGKVFLVSIWFLGLLALVVLWRRKPHTVLDIWLLVVMSAWLFDIALSAVLNTGRYDLGWYAGRIYGLTAACYLLIVLLSENASHYDRLVRSAADLQMANKSLLQISLQDGLTGIANRRAFDKCLAEQIAVAVRYKRPLALAIVDVDHFKNYNDEYGHQAGDECLKIIAEALNSRCQRPQDMAARYGGEEFAMVLPDTDRTGAAHVVESARVAVATSTIPDGMTATGRQVSVSIGVAILQPEYTVKPEELIATADAALYKAKLNGRNQSVLTEAPED